MRDHVPVAPERPNGSAIMSPAEKLMCEWEARHDVAARGRHVDPAAALHRYLTHTHIEEELRHRGQPVQRSESVASRRARHPDEFAVRHLLTASWIRWGEDPR
jgi:hypothetical protein